MSGISRFVPRSVRFRIRRPGAAGAASLACAAMLNLGGAGFWTPAAATGGQTCEQLGATCRDPKGKPGCCAAKCSSRSRCTWCCLNGFPAMGENYRLCIEGCETRFPDKHDLEPGDFPAL